MKWTAIACCVLLVFGASAVSSEPTAKVEKVELPREVTPPFRKLLTEHAIRLYESTGTPYATIWFRESIPSNAAPEQIKNGLTYREVAPTTFIGVLQLDAPWVDFRKQRIAAGVYTLRIAVQPMTGDHDMTAPHADFCLLVPMEKDPKPEVMEVKELYDISAHSTGTSHPSVMLLFPNNRPADEPRIVSKPDQVWVLEVKRPIDADGKKASLGFGLTVLGHSKIR